MTCWRSARGRARRPNGCGIASGASRPSSLTLPPPRKLGERFAGTNVAAVAGDATALPYPDESFDTVAMFTMLHHVPTRAMQDAILAGALRALRPGGTLIGSDSLASDRLHRHHEGDTYNPVEPAAFLTRLQTIGFGEITLTVSDRLLFRARKD